MASRLILTTRPAGDAAEDIAFLEQHGRSAMSAPMLEIKPLDPALPDASEFDAVVFTSRHAAGMVGDRGFHEKPCYCVGEATALEAQKAGFTCITTGPGDGEGLAGLIGGENPGRVFWASGLHTGFDMEKALAPMGVEATRLAVYEAARTAGLAPDALAAIRNGDVGVVLVHSGRAGEHFSDLLDRHGLRPQKAAMALIAISSRAAGLCGEGWHTIEVVDSPLRTAMLDAALGAAGRD